MKRLIPIAGACCLLLSGCSNSEPSTILNDSYSSINEDTTATTEETQMNPVQIIPQQTEKVPQPTEPAEKTDITSPNMPDMPEETTTSDTPVYRYTLNGLESVTLQCRTNIDQWIQTAEDGTQTFDSVAAANALEFQTDKPKEDAENSLSFSRDVQGKTVHFSFSVPLQDDTDTGNYVPLSHLSCTVGTEAGVERRIEIIQEAPERAVLLLPDEKSSVTREQIVLFVYCMEQMNEHPDVDPLDFVIPSYLSAQTDEWTEYDLP